VYPAFPDPHGVRRCRSRVSHWRCHWPRDTINLSDLDIEVVKPRKAVTGALLLEITGEDADRKDSRLAERMAEVLRDYPVKVAVPRRTAVLRVFGLKDSVTLEEVVSAVAKAGGCCAEELNVGVIRTAPRRLGSMWIRCPLTATRKVNGSTGGRGDAPPIGKLRIIMAPRLRHLFTRCLKEGVYPPIWRTARLVLLRKEGRPIDSPSAYRPICLLDEVGKLLERVIAVWRPRGDLGHPRSGCPVGTTANTSFVEAVRRWTR
jgi:hypothetical protein